MSDVSETAADELTPEQVRTMGDATVGQRAELRQLLQAKLYSTGWRDQLFADTFTEKGLSATRATAVLDWLRDQADRDQAEEILELLRVRLAPGPFGKLHRTLITEGTLTRHQADHALRDLRRLPLREFPMADKPGKVRTSNVPAGQYAVKGSDARTRHYRVTMDVVGAHEIKRINGQRRERRFVRTASEVEQILRQIAGDPAAAARLYAEETKKCAAPQCNKPLYDKGQPGYEHGFGPDCWKKIVAARKIRDNKALIPDADD